MAAPDRCPSLRRAGPATPPRSSAVHRGAYTSRPGTAARPPATPRTVRRWWLDDEDVFCYLAPDGFLAYGWQRGHRDIFVRQAGRRLGRDDPGAVVGREPRTWRMAERCARWCPPHDPLGWLTREPDVALLVREPWMLRVVDAPQAVAGRGFPGRGRLAVTLQLDDAAPPGQHGPVDAGGRWRPGTLHPAVTQPPAPASPAGPVRLGARGFAALYAGMPDGHAAPGRPGRRAATPARTRRSTPRSPGRAFMLVDF